MDAPHILVVDDHQDIRQAVGEIVERDGFKVSTAANGAEMRRILKREQIDLIVLDRVMPGEDGLGLLMDFFQHVVRVAAFFRGCGIPRDFGLLPADRPPIQVGNRDFPSRHNGHVSFFEKRNVPRMGEHRHHVGPDEGGTVRLPDDERAARTSRDQRARFPVRDHRQRVTPVNLFGRGADGICEARSLSHVLVDEMGHHFGVGFRLEFISRVLELLLQGHVIFDNPVVHQHAALGAMRMCVLLGWLPVGRPPRMPDAASAGEIFLRQ